MPPDSEEPSFPASAASAAPNVTAPGYGAGQTEGLTQHGRDRLEQNRDGLFTSDLSVASS